MKRILPYAILVGCLLFSGCGEESPPQDIPYQTLGIKRPIEVKRGDRNLYLRFSISSDFASDGYILFRLVKDMGREGGFADSLDVDGFYIRSYFPLYDKGVPMDYPVYIKKITLPDNGSYNEEIHVRIPESANEINMEADITVFRDSEKLRYKMEDFYEKMIRYINGLDNYNDDFFKIQQPYFEKYFAAFPDSSVFSYFVAITGALHEINTFPSNDERYPAGVQYSYGLVNIRISKSIAEQNIDQ